MEGEGLFEDVEGFGHFDVLVVLLWSYWLLVGVVGGDDG